MEFFRRLSVCALIAFGLIGLSACGESETPKPANHKVPAGNPEAKATDADSSDSKPTPSPTKSSSQTATSMPFADRIPSDALVYIGWAGTDKITQYPDSHLKGVLDAWNLKKLIHDTLIPLAIEQGGNDGQQVASVLQMASEIVPVIYQRPWAIYVGGMKPSTPDSPPSPLAAIMIDAGPHVEKLHQMISQLLKDPTGPAAMVRLDKVGSELVLSPAAMPKPHTLRLGINNPASKGANSPIAPITDNTSFANATQHVYANASGVFFVDIAKTMTLAEQMMPPNDPETKEFQQAAQMFGLKNLKGMISTIGFQDRSWRTDVWVHAPSPRQGIFKMLDGKPLSQTVFKTVPKTATWFQAARMDLGGLVQSFKKMAALTDPNAANEYDNARNEIKAEMGFDFQTDLIDTLGEEWLMYNDQTAPGAFGVNLLLVHWLKDSAKMTATLDKIEAFANKMLASQSDELKIQIQKKVEDDLTIRYLSFPMINPAWAIYKDRLLIAMSPQALSARAQLDKTPSDSILDRPEYQSLLAKLGSKNPTGVTFTDLPQTTPKIMEQLTGLATTLASATEDKGPKIDPLAFLPPLGKLLPHLKASATVTWSDDSGYYARSISPFPMADAFGPSTGMSSALGAAILLPALAKARSTAKRIASAANMRGLFQSMYTWSLNNKDQFPADLSVLIKDGSAHPRM